MYVCYSRMHEIPQTDLDRMARLQLAFLAVMDEHAALIAFQEFVDLIQSGIILQNLLRLLIFTVCFGVGLCFVIYRL